jgi:hypothetical protein
VKFNLGHFILNKFLKNTKKAMNNIFSRLTYEQNCTNCTDEIDLDDINYNIDKDKIKTLNSLNQNHNIIISKKSDDSLSERKKI